jgi:DNA modification methylase
MTLAKRIAIEAQNLKQFNLKELYSKLPDEKQTTIRGRIYRELMGLGIIERKGKGIYIFKGDQGQEGVILRGDARNLSVFHDRALDLIIADHPYEIVQGTNRSFNESYVSTTFEYFPEDFKGKARTLKDGAFLVEFLPEMKERNWEYILRILSFAKDAGFSLYCKVPWYKARISNGRLVDGSAFVGRKAVMEDIYIFSKGQPRKLRQRKQGDKVRNERGAVSMFPAVFMESPVNPCGRIHKAEKPESLIRRIIAALSLEGELVLDQFAGSLVTFFTALKMKRRAVAIELDEVNIEKAINQRQGNDSPNN